MALAGCPSGQAYAKEWSPAQVIERIALVAESVGRQAQVGGMEIAGMIISYLAEHPAETEAFLRDGVEYIISGNLRVESGRLTFHRRLDGKVTTPQELRAAIMVKNMERGKPVDRQRG